MTSPVATAAELIQTVRQAGGEVLLVAPDRLRVRAPVPLPEALLASLRQHKAAVVDLLARDPGEEVSRAWRDWVAGETERLTGRHRCARDAALLGYSGAVERWHRLYGERQDPERCAACGGLDGPLIGPSAIDRSVVHLRGDCLERYGAMWRGRAVDGLRAAGIMPPAGWEP